MRGWLGALLMMSVSLAAIPAHAADDASGGMALLTTTVGATTSIALAGIGTYALSSKDDNRRSAAAAMLFLRNHATDVRQTVATGNGVLLQEIGRAHV